MSYDFELKGSGAKPYNPEDYGLPVWRDEDHPTPQQVQQVQQAQLVAQMNKVNIYETRKALQLLWDNINRLYQKQLYKWPEIKELLDKYDVK